MSAVLDIIGSALIGGLLLITMLRMNTSGLENQSYFTEDLIVQENLREIVRIIESDFRKIGYNIPPDGSGNIDMSKIFVFGDSTHLIFQADFNRSGIPVNVEYQLGDPITSTPNQSDRYLWRKIGNDPRKNIAAGLVRFRLRYLNRYTLFIYPSVTLVNVDSIGSIEVTLELQSPYVVVRVGQTALQSYRETTTLWRQTRLVARNLNR
jgi:hypothetical protein